MNMEHLTDYATKGLDGCKIALAPKATISSNSRNPTHQQMPISMLPTIKSPLSQFSAAAIKKSQHLLAPKRTLY